MLLDYIRAKLIFCLIILFYALFIHSFLNEVLFSLKKISWRQTIYDILNVMVQNHDKEYIPIQIRNKLYFNVLYALKECLKIKNVQCFKICSNEIGKTEVLSSDVGNLKM